MARFKPPKLEKHVRGEARVRYRGKEHWLGPWGPDPVPAADVLREYARLLAHLEEQHAARLAGVAEPQNPAALLVAEAIALYLDHMENDLDGARRADGTLTSAYERARQACRPLDAMFGDQVAEDFTAKDLKTVRDAIKRGSWWVQGMSGRPAVEVSARTANRRMGEVVRCFQWLESECHVSPGKTEHLRTVGHLPPEKRKPRAVVPADELEALLPFCPPPIAALLQLQRMTAARPGELLCMRPVDVDTSGPVWVFSPASHKNDWREDAEAAERLIPIGPDAQAVLAPFLERGLSEFCFRPAEAWEWQVEYRRACRPARKTKRHKSEARRVDAARRRSARRREWLDHYTRDTYRRSVKRAIERAVEAGVKVSYFCPYQLRHTRITEVQKAAGWDAAQAVAGHTSPNMTAKYAHERHERALAIAAETVSRPPAKRAGGA